MSKLNIDSTYGVVVVQDYKAVWMDENYAKIFGYESAKDLLDSTESFLDLIEPAQRDRAVQNYHDVISGSVVPRGHTFKNLDKNGRVFTIFAIDHVIEWEGSPALQVTVIDLTRIEQADKKIREVNKQFMKLITESRQGIMVHRNFKPLFVNQAWVNLLRAESIEFVLSQESILDRVLPENRQIAILRQEEILNSSGSFHESHLYQNICYDNTKRYFNVYDTLIEWNGKPALHTVLEDVTEKVALQKQLEYRANHDQLTELYNRSAVYDKLEAECRGAKTTTCLLIDIDNFKSVNDNFGHHEGDEVIRQFSSILRDTVAGQGIIGRWGGEEFIVFVIDMPHTKALELAENIRINFHRHVFDFIKGELVSSVSIGLSSANCQCSNPEGIDKLVKEADHNMYLAKANGKNQVKW